MPCMHGKAFATTKMNEQEEETESVLQAGVDLGRKMTSTTKSGKMPQCSPARGQEGRVDECLAILVPDLSDSVGHD